MQGLHRRILITIAVAFTATSASAQYLDEPMALRQDSGLPTFTASEWLERSAPPTRLVRPAAYTESGATFIKLHFSRLELPEGVYVEISNPAGTETWRYSSNDRDLLTIDETMGDDGIQSFWAMSISGDTAIVRLSGRLSRFDPSVHGFEIDTQYADIVRSDEYSSKIKTKEPLFTTESTCGESERYDAICWAESYPDQFERSSPVALLITSTGKKCTAWRVGNENRLFTAQHCVSSQSQLDGAEIWFNYQSTVCGSDEPAEPVKVTGDQLLLEDYDYDFALFTVNDFASIDEFGNMGLDLRDGEIGEEIFIPQHGLGNPKQIAIESDMNGGLCRIDDNDLYGMVEGSDIGYYCDTVTSSSGSPVISGETGRVLALHHWGGCLNSGTKMSRIWPLVEGYFDGVPEGNADGKWKSANELPVARIAASCDGLACELDASGSADSDGSIESYEWMIGEDMFSGSAVSYEFAEGGDYTVTLAVTDDEGATNIVDETVTVDAPNLAPEARFSTSCVENRCSFNASGSSDPDGDLVSWNWNFGDGSSASGQAVEHEYDSSGDFNVELTVEDDDGETDKAGYTASITLPNEAPDATFSISCTDLSCSVDAGASSDPDGNVVDWSWNFGDGHEASGQSASHTYDNNGSYTLRLVVTDDDGATDSFQRDVSVEKPAEGPVASFSVSCDELNCVLDAGSSTASESPAPSYDWSFGDGTTATGGAVQHQYTSDGVYTVTLKVTDGSGSSTTTKTVNVQRDEPDELVLVAAADLSKDLATVELNWTGAENGLQLYRNGQLIAAVDAKGSYSDKALKGKGPTVAYNVCDSETGQCSNIVKLQLGKI